MPKAAPPVELPFAVKLHYTGGGIGPPYFGNSTLMMESPVHFKAIRATANAPALDRDRKSLFKETTLRSFLLSLLTAVVLLLPMATPASKAAPGKEQHGGKGRGKQVSARVVVFSGRDQEMIRRYFQTNTSNLPPGLAKRGGNLPPGLERHLQRNGTLPPGLQKRIQPFPQELSQQMSPLPAGYSRVIVGARVLIIDRANRIFDIMFIHQ